MTNTSQCARNDNVGGEGGGVAVRGGVADDGAVCRDDGDGVASVAVTRTTAMMTAIATTRAIMILVLATMTTMTIAKAMRMMMHAMHLERVCA